MAGNGVRRGLLLLLTICHAMAPAVWPAASVAASYHLRWDAVDHPTPVRYRVYRATEVAGPYTLLKTTTATSTRVSVPLDARRCYRVRAVDDLGQASAMSEYLCYTITTETGE